MATIKARLGLVDVRAQIVAAARWGITNTAAIHYSMGADRDDWLARLPKQLKQLPLTTDCSGFFTWCYRVAGAPDPNGLGYKALGFTGTLMGHGRQISRLEVKPGDAVIWGAYPGVHVAMALARGGDVLMSHGQEAGPLLISFDSENAYHLSHGHKPTFWRFPTTKAEAKAHTPEGFVQHPVPPAVVVTKKPKATTPPPKKPRPRKPGGRAVIQKPRPS
jgi:hypothetical protein